MRHQSVEDEQGPGTTAKAGYGGGGMPPVGVVGMTRQVRWQVTEDIDATAERPLGLVRVSQVDQSLQARTRKLPGVTIPV